MRIGILGASGFVGTNLCHYLLEEAGVGRVDCASRRTCPPTDARDYKQLHKWVSENEITHLVNLAAECGGIGLNAISPASLWASVTAISNNVLKVAHECKLERTIMVGTVCSYARDCPVPFREDDLMSHGLPEETNRAYGMAKLAAVYGGIAYNKQYGVSITNLVPANMYGPWDHFSLLASHVIPAIIRKISNAIKTDAPGVVLWGDGSATRDFLNVRDFCRAVYLALTVGVPPIPINIGTGVETSIKELATLIAAKFNYTGEIRWNTSEPNGQPRRRLDIKRALETLGYQPTVSLEQGIQETIDWFHHPLSQHWIEKT